MAVGHIASAISGMLDQFSRKIVVLELSSFQLSIVTDEMRLRSLSQFTEHRIAMGH